MSDFTNSILPAAARLIVPAQCVFSVYLLLRGHNLPGGGFIGGLVLASALVLRSMANVERAPKWDPTVLAGWGLLTAVFAALVPVALGMPLFTGLWGGEVWLPVLGKLKLGTPLLFDVGVFMVVTGVGAKMLLVLLAQRRQAEPDATD